MPLDGISSYFLAEELNEALSGARIDKVQQPSRSDIILSLRNHGRNRKLILSANPSQPRIHFTEENRDMPQIAPRFCMLLRKYLVGSRIEKVETIGYDRVFVFHILTSDELGDTSSRRLILEVMGRYSNLIFVSSSDIIIDAINHVDSTMSRVREVMPARPFVAAPVQDKMEPADALRCLMEKKFWPESGDEDENAKPEQIIMDRIQGFSPQLSRDICERAGIDGRRNFSGLEESERARLHESLNNVLAEILAGIIEPSVFFLEGSDTPSDFHALPLVTPGRREKRDSLSDAIAEFYVAKEASNAFKQRRQFLERIVTQARTKLRKKRDIHARDVYGSENYDHYREQGDILMSNLHLVKEGDSSITVPNFYDPEMQEITIELNPHRSPSWNGQQLYKLYNKNKTRFEQASAFLEEDEAELLWLDSLLNEIANAETMDDLALVRDEMRSAGLLESTGPKAGGRKSGDFHSRKRARSANGSKNDRSAASRPAPMRKFISSDGFTILAGRNNLQNDRLTLKVAAKSDIWFHIQKAAGTHVVVRAEGREVPDRTLQEAAEIAAWFSRLAKASREMQQSGAKLPVDYCPVSHVRKPSGARPGMVIYDGYNTMMVEAKNPDHLLPLRDSDEEDDQDI